MPDLTTRHALPKIAGNENVNETNLHALWDGIDAAIPTDAEIMMLHTETIPFARTGLLAIGNLQGRYTFEEAGDVELLRVSVETAPGAGGLNFRVRRFSAADIEQQLFDLVIAQGARTVVGDPAMIGAAGEYLKFELTAVNGAADLSGKIRVRRA